MDTNQPELTPLLDVDDVVALLRCKKDWLYDAVQQRSIQHVRVGGRHIRFRATDIQAYIASRVVPVEG